MNLYLFDLYFEFEKLSSLQPTKISESKSFYYYVYKCFLTRCGHQRCTWPSWRNRQAAAESTLLSLHRHHGSRVGSCGHQCVGRIRSMSSRIWGGPEGKSWKLLSYSSFYIIDIKEKMFGTTCYLVPFWVLISTEFIKFTNSLSFASFHWLHSYLLIFRKQAMYVNKCSFEISIHCFFFL